MNKTKEQEDISINVGNVEDSGGNSNVTNPAEELAQLRTQVHYLKETINNLQSERDYLRESLESERGYARRIVESDIEDRRAIMSAFIELNGQVHNSLGYNEYEPLIDSSEPKRTETPESTRRIVVFTAIFIMVLIQIYLVLYSEGYLL
jgi:cell division protein FtsB